MIGYLEEIKSILLKEKFIFNTRAFFLCIKFNDLITALILNVKLT